MLVHKAFKYRIYPTPAQAARLDSWSDALRFLWNLANEQRLIAYGKPKCERRYPTAFDQINELTGLRKELPWLADVPRNVSAQLLVQLDAAWQRCFARLAEAPQWKRKGVDVVSLCEPDPKGWRLDADRLHFPKIGSAIRAVIHRPLEGKAKTCTIVRDGDQWFAVITCELTVDEPEPRTAPVVAIDRGITHLLADSDGVLTANPHHLHHALKRLAKAQRVVCRRKKGSKNQQKAKLRVMRLHRKVRRQRAHHQHVESARYAKSHGIVVVENLNVAGMIKSRLARSISDAGWSGFVEKLRYKLAWSGGRLVEVPAHYSSQTCSACGHVDAASRIRERFVCTACGFVDHADLNAAKVLLHRANRSVMPVDGVWPAQPGRSRKAEVVKLRNVRRTFVNTGRQAG